METETEFHVREPCVEHSQECCKYANPAHKKTEDHLLQLLDDITRCVQQHLDGKITRGEQNGQLPQVMEILYGQGVTGQSLLRLLEVLRGLGDLHTERTQAWRRALSTTAQLCTRWQQAMETRTPGCASNDNQSTLMADADESPHGLIAETIAGVLEDIQCIDSRLSAMTQKLSRATITLSEEKTTCTDEGKQEKNTTQEPGDPHSSSCDHVIPHTVIGLVGHRQEEESFRDVTAVSADQHLGQSDSDPEADHPEDGPSSVGGRRSSKNTQQDSTATSQRPGSNNGHPTVLTPLTHRDIASASKHIRSSLDGVRAGLSVVRDGEKEGLMEEGDMKERRDAELEEESQGIRHGWVTKGLSGKPEMNTPDLSILCYITAPLEVSEAMTCDLVNGLSSLMVLDLEELVSNVLRLRLPDNIKCSFPITVAIPFQSRYRGNYRDIIVKVVDQASRVSYINPASVEGNYKGQKGLYAHVRVYALGVFAVVSCLRRESYTIPKRGLSLRLSMDSRICLDYLPGSFPFPVVAQAVVQPVDPSLLSTLKSNRDMYQALLTSSPLLYLSHPSCQPLRRPLALTLPCPPNPEHQRPGEEGDPGHPRPTSAVHAHDSPLQQRIRYRAVSASVKMSREVAKEHLVLLGWIEEQWNVLDNVSVRNLQNGLVSFELMEHFERLIVLRLQGHVRPSHLTSMVEEIEDSMRHVMVTIVLQRLRQDPHTVVVAALPSTDLSWEMAKLQAQAYCGPPEPSREIAMSEGDQLLLSFRGNITADWGSVDQRAITFHHQRKSHEHLKLMVVDPFGNYSSPHYKGLVVFHRLPRTQLAWMDDAAVPSPQHPLVEPVCKLCVTLPKKLRITSRLASAKVTPHTQYESLSDELLAWLCEELCEEEVAFLMLALRVKRSAVQLARLRAPADGLPHQAFHVLGMWRRSLPSHAPKAPLLARCLARVGRPDLAKELLLREGGRGGEG